MELYAGFGLPVCGTTSYVGDGPTYCDGTSEKQVEDGSDGTAEQAMSEKNLKYVARDFFVVMPVGADLDQLESNGYFDGSTTYKPYADRPYLIRRDNSAYPEIKATNDAFHRKPNPYAPGTNMQPFKKAPNAHNVYYLVEQPVDFSQFEEATVSGGRQGDGSDSSPDDGTSSDGNGDDTTESDDSSQSQSSQSGARTYTNARFSYPWKSQFLSGLMMPLMNFVGNFGYVIVCVVGAALAMDGQIEFGVIVAFMMYIRLFTQPLSQFAQAFQNLQRCAAAAERVFGFLEEPEMDAEPTKAELGVADAAASTARTDSGKLARRGTRANATAGMTASQRSQLLGYDAAGNPRTVRGDVEFSHVRFGYEPDKPIIHDFSASVSAGQKVAIVGPTGAGKTTMVNLLMRFYEISGGSISIDGIDTTSVPRWNVHDQFSMVLQDTWVFRGTVRENIAYSKPGVTDEQIVSACKAVGLDHFVRSLPQGYDTVLDDNTSLSQGQRQLLTIARAMVQDAPILILDEATSSVDTRTEELIQKAMDALTVGRTSFVIAHRLSTIRDADMILVMNHGDVIERGTHEELLAAGGFYADLYNSQFTLTD